MNDVPGRRNLKDKRARQPTLARSLRLVGEMVAMSKALPKGRHAEFILGFLTPRSPERRDRRARFCTANGRKP